VLSPSSRAVAEVDQETAAGTLEGQVLSWSTAEPIPEAELTFARSDTVSSTITDLGGGFVFRASEPGTYELVAVTADGYLPFAPELGHSPVSLEARPGFRIRDIVIHLRPIDEVVGRVIDPDGEPVEGAEVVVVSVPGGGGNSSLSTFQDGFVSDVQGEFPLQAPLGSVLEARAPGYSPGRARFERTARSRGVLVIRLGTGSNDANSGEIAGQVVDGSGLGVPGALILARVGPGSAGELRASGQALGDEQGFFVIEGLDQGTYLLVATADGLAPGRVAGVSSGERNARIVLNAGSTISGVVTEAASNDPVPSFSVVIERAFGPLRRSTYRTESVFDAQGRFEVTGVEPGNYAVHVTSPGYSPSSELDVALEPGERAVRADFELARGGRARGRVVDAATGEPVADARVSVESRDDGSETPVPLVAQTVTRLDGTFEIQGLTPGRRSLLVSAQGYRMQLLSGLTVRDDTDIGPLDVRLTPVEDEGDEPGLELTGIGAVLAPRVMDMVVVRVLDGGGAAEVGLAPGDAVVTIDGLPVVELGFTESIERIRGQEGTAVRLGVIRSATGAQEEITVIRRRVLG
jgi:protocatechuate 3,4-dioxygenase beta subunit